MMERVYNFAAGPAVLPLPVLEKAQKELLSYGDAGCSVLEMSHRSSSYQDIIDRAEQTLREIMNIGDDYAVLFLQGGASLQFSMTAMNLADRGDKADYAVTGSFASKALAEGKRWCDAVAITSGKENNFTHIPALTPDLQREGAKFVHLTVNNTIYGTMYDKLPQGFKAPLVCDMSSVMLGHEYNVNDCGLIYAGAQKNCGPAGLTIVIIRRDLIRDDLDEVIPTMLRYSIHAKGGSMYNTPPAFAIYIAGMVFEWVKAQGGVAALEKINREKAAMLYDFIDNSSIFTGVAAPDSRSIMNVTFTLPDEQKTADFIALAKSRGLISIKGHRSVGGCRASIYNAMPIEGVRALVDCMKDFETANK